MSTEAKVGVFVIASLLVLGSAIYFVRTTQTVRGQVPYRTYLRYAGGLAPGAAVLFGGIKVGQVTAVRPASEDPTRIEIAFDVKTGTPINEKSTAQVGSVSIMSSPALSITTGSNEARRLSAGEVVPSAGSREPGRNHAPRGRRCRVGERADDHPWARGSDPDRRRAEVPCESQRDQRSAEPETNRAYPCEPQHAY